MRAVRQCSWLLAGLLASGAALSAAPAQRTRDSIPDAPRTAPQTRPPVRSVVPDRPPARPPIADALEGVFANGLQRRLALDDDQLNRIRPALRASLRRRNQLAQESIRQRNELNRALEENRSEDDIDALVADLDGTNRELREAREAFFRAVDPDLSPRQRARLRSELPRLEEQIRNLIERSRQQR